MNADSFVPLIQRFQNSQPPDRQEQKWHFRREKTIENLFFHTNP